MIQLGDKKVSSKDRMVQLGDKKGSSKDRMIQFGDKKVSSKDRKVQLGDKKVTNCRKICSQCSDRSREVQLPCLLGKERSTDLPTNQQTHRIP